MIKKIQLKFNPDNMTVADLKKAAETLRGLLQAYDGLIGDDQFDEATTHEEVGWRVSQFRDAYIID